MLTVKLILYNLFYACDSDEPNPHFFKVKNKEKLKNKKKYFSFVQVKNNFAHFGGILYKKITKNFFSATVL